MPKLNANTDLNPNAPKVCFLDIDGVVVEIGAPPYEVKPEIVKKVRQLHDDGWQIVAFTCRSLESVKPLIQKGLPISGWMPKPLASEIMIIDDCLSEARNYL